MTAPIGIEREPPVPPPLAIRSESPWTTLISIERKVELPGDDLGVSGLVPLAGRLGADEQSQRPILLEKERRFLAGAHGRAFDIACETEPSNETTAPGLVRASLETGGVGLFDTPLQRGAEVADVIGALRLGVVRHRFRRHEVSQPDRLLGQAELARAPVDEALEDISRFRTACAAIGVDRDRVRIDASHPRMQRVDLVGPVRHRDAEPRHELSVLREIGAQVRDDVDPERQKTSLGVERHLGGGHVVAPLRVADKMFGPVGLPPNRLAKPARGFENQGYSRYRKICVPKPPPTSSVRTLRFAGGIFSTFATTSRSACTPWLPRCNVNRPLAGSNDPTAPRGSM